MEHVQSRYSSKYNIYAKHVSYNTIIYKCIVKNNNMYEKLITDHFIDRRSQAIDSVRKWREC